MKKEVIFAAAISILITSCATPQPGSVSHSDGTSTFNTPQPKEILAKETVGIAINLSNIHNVQVNNVSSRQVATLDDSTFVINYTGASDTNEDGKIDRISYLLITPEGSKALDLDLPADKIDSFNSTPNLADQLSKPSPLTDAQLTELQSEINTELSEITSSSGYTSQYLPNINWGCLLWNGGWQLFSTVRACWFLVEAPPVFAGCLVGALGYSGVIAVMKCSLSDSFNNRLRAQ